MQKRALLAILFAGGMLDAQLPAISQQKSQATDMVIRQIADSEKSTPEIRAFYLLKVAGSYLAGISNDAVKTNYDGIFEGPNKNSWMFNLTRTGNILSPWVDDVASSPKAVHKSALADEAIDEALKQLGKATDKYAKLNMYYVASCLYRESGNKDGLERCKFILDRAFRLCEVELPANKADIEASSSVLNAMAYGLISVKILDYDEPQAPAKPFSEAAFKASEKLKLRAVAMTDRLPTTSFERRKAHRDLVVWYKLLGKNQLAEKEQQVLFELVGIKDESILYPKRGGCGRLVWWKTDVVDAGFDCGMG